MIQLVPPIANAPQMANCHHIEFEKIGVLDNKKTSTSYGRHRTSAKITHLLSCLENSGRLGWSFVVLIVCPFRMDYSYIRSSPETASVNPLGA